MRKCEVSEKRNGDERYVVLCVPRTMEDYQIKDMADEDRSSGTSWGWGFTDASKEAPEIYGQRIACEHYPENIHVALIPFS